MQKSAAITHFEQSVTLDCDKFKETAWSYYNNCIQRFAHFSDDQIKELCSYPDSFRCEARDIVMDQHVNVDVTNEQQADIITNVKKSLSTNLESQLRHENNVLTFGNKTKADIRRLIEVTDEIFQSSIQSIYSDIDGRQTIKGFGGQISFVTLQATYDYLLQMFMDNEEWFAAATDVSVDIGADLKQQNLLLSTVFTIGLSILGVVIVVAVAILVIHFTVRKISGKRKIKIS